MLNKILTHLIFLIIIFFNNQHAFTTRSMPKLNVYLSESNRNLEFKVVIGGKINKEYSFTILDVAPFFSNINQIKCIFPKSDRITMNHNDNFKLKIHRDYTIFIIKESTYNKYINKINKTESFIVSESIFDNPFSFKNYLKEYYNLYKDIETLENTSNSILEKYDYDESIKRKLDESKNDELKKSGWNVSRQVEEKLPNLLHEINDFIPEKGKNQKKIKLETLDFYKFHIIENKRQKMDDLKSRFLANKERYMQNFRINR